MSAHATAVAAAHHKIAEQRRLIEQQEQGLVRCGRRIDWLEGQLRRLRELVEAQHGTLSRLQEAWVYECNNSDNLEAMVRAEISRHAIQVPEPWDEAGEIRDADFTVEESNGAQRVVG